MDRDKKDADGTYRQRCGKAGCLTHPAMCKPWMCPDYREQSK